MNGMLKPHPQDITRAALEDAAALIEHLRARVEELRDELDTAAITWSDAATAQDLASELLYVSAKRFYDTTTPEATIRERVLADARAQLARVEGRR